ncbi:LysR substrate-binding domain-containing protein [Pseudohoeflea coraliihabitans]|uniref:LysR family transcriptional regulator n=1 Tax=Pseudohoeflea coraliihabitans TaxID=2860393 RepID=A0ABS6WT51_9HYPH|nr:LysR substrate-binding domain-containing protein [Pseudohoeflea sp. DP4N28-3]MBW3098960.1 LysR family transcriptional regulator [Pseudohoeflea sp. DP4N28-3]
MDSRQLRYFREIIDSGSMSGAARNLGIAQPSLSQLVRNLEAVLGTELLVRSARGIAPTEAGERLHLHACAIEAMIEEAQRDVVDIGAEPSGRVAFGMTPSISMALSIPMAETIRVEMPKVQFTATEAMSGHLREWVLKGEIDMALLYDNTNIGECASSELLIEDLWIYAASDCWPFESAPGEPVTFAQVAETELVLPSERHGLRAYIDRVAQSERLTLNVPTEMDSLPQIKALVARGSGHTILSPAAVHDLVSAGTLVGAPIGEPRLRRSIYLVRSTNRVTRATRQTEDLCREVVRDLINRRLWQAELPRDE